MEDAAGWPRGPPALSVAVVAADAHGTVGRLAGAAERPLARMSEAAGDVEALIAKRAVLLADHDLRESQFRRVDEMAGRIGDGTNLAAEVATAASAYMRSLHALDRATAHLRSLLEAFDEALEAEEQATMELLAGARLAHAERAAKILAPVVDRGGDDPSGAFASLLDRCRTDADLLPEAGRLADLLDDAKRDSAHRLPAKSSVLGHFEASPGGDGDGTRRVTFLRRRWSSERGGGDGDNEPNSPEERRSETMERAFLSTPFFTPREHPRDTPPLPDDLLDRLGVRERPRDISDDLVSVDDSTDEEEGQFDGVPPPDAATRRAAARVLDDLRPNGAAAPHEHADDDAADTDGDTEPSWESGSDVDLYSM